jgi:biotin transport system substrate-specific component
MTTRDLGFVALFAALIVALGLIPAFPVPGLPVPITPQSMGVMMAGLILGPKRGALAPLVVIVLVAIGLPVLSGGRGGLGVIVGPSAGYLFGFVAAAFVTGFLAEILDDESKSKAARIFGLVLAAIVGGIVVDHIMGIAWLAFATKMGLMKAMIGDIMFVPGDLAKAVIAALVTIKVREAFRLERK